MVLEATWGWYWAADVLEEMGARVHLAHPLGVKGFENRRVKNDDKDATLLAMSFPPDRGRFRYAASAASDPMSWCSVS